MNDFERDNAWQLQVRDRFLAPFYGRYSLEGRYVFVDKGRCARLIQKRMAVDTIAQSRRGGAVCIEEKIVRREYPCFFLETESCTKPGHESSGWMTYAEADYLLYCFETASGSALKCYLIDFPALKEWFWKEHGRFRRHQMRGTLNETAGQLVPIHEVQRALGPARCRFLVLTARPIAQTEEATQ